MSKQEQVKKHLLAGKSITGLSALKLFGLYRLSHVIYVLRKEGHRINTKMITRNNVTFASYSLDK